MGGTVRETGIAVAWAWLGAVAVVALGGCSEAIPGSEFDSEGVIGSSCRVEPDQRKSFMAKVPGFPVEIQIDSTFTARERAAVDDAILEWNRLGRSLMGEPFFGTRTLAIPAAQREQDPRDCQADAFGDAREFSLIRESSLERWKGLGFSTSIPGATLRCYRGRQIDHQVVLVYPSVIDPLQLGSVVLHELGHAIGLDHSCVEGQGRDRYRGCAGLAEDHPYRVASLYPTLKTRRTATELPELKNALRVNDELRTGCLYAQ